MSSDQEQDLIDQLINLPPEDEDDGTGITHALGMDAYFDDAAADEVNRSSVHEQPNAEQIPKMNIQSESHNTTAHDLSSSKSRSFDNLPEIRLNSAPPANTARMYDASDSSQYVIKRRNTLGLTPSDILRLTGDSPLEENVFSTQENKLKNDDNAVNTFSNNFLQRQYYEATEALSGHRERWENDVVQDNFRYNDADSLNKWKNDEGNADVGFNDDSTEGINSTSMQESRLADAVIPQHAWDNKDRNPTQTSFNPLPPYSDYPQDLNTLREYMSKSKVSREKVKHIKAIMKKNEPELNESSQETSTRHISYAAIKAARRKPVKKVRKSKLNSEDSDNRDTKSLRPSFVVPPVTSTATVENTQIPEQEELATHNPDDESRNLQNFKSQFFPDDNDP